MVRISAAHSVAVPSIVEGHALLIIVHRQTEDGRFPCISLLPKESANALSARVRWCAGRREEVSSNESGSALLSFGPIAATIATRASGVSAVLISPRTARLAGGSPASHKPHLSQWSVSFLERRPARQRNSKLIHIEASESGPLSSRASPVYSRLPVRLRRERRSRSQMSPDRLGALQRAGSPSAV